MATMTIETCFRDQIPSDDVRILDQSIDASRWVRVIIVLWIRRSRWPNLVWKPMSSPFTCVRENESWTRCVSEWRSWSFTSGGPRADVCRSNWPPSPPPPLLALFSSTTTRRLALPLRIDRLARASSNPREARVHTPERRHGANLLSKPRQYSRRCHCQWCRRLSLVHRDRTASSESSWIEFEIVSEDVEGQRTSMDLFWLMDSIVRLNRRNASTDVSHRRRASRIGQSGSWYEWVWQRKRVVQNQRRKDDCDRG